MTSRTDYQTGARKGRALMAATIRPACLEDAQALHRHCYPDHEYGDVRDYLAWCLRQADKGWIVRLVAEVDGQAVGTAQLTQWGHRGEIGSLVVAPDYRRRGIGRQLLAALIEEAERRGLDPLDIRASEGHPFLVAFYQRLGFCRVEGAEEPRASEPEMKSGPFHPDRTVLLRMLRSGR